MPRRRHGNNRVVEEGQELQGHVRWHQGHDHQVVAVVGQALDHLGAVDHGQVQVDVRLLLLEGGKQVRHEVLGAGFHCQGQLALQRALQVGELHVEAFQALEDIRAGALERFGGVGQVELLADVFEQRLADQLFQLANLQADGRLGEGHVLGGAAVGAVVAHCAEHLNLPQGQAHQGFTHALVLALLRLKRRWRPVDSATISFF